MVDIYNRDQLPIEFPSSFCFIYNPASRFSLSFKQRAPLRRFLGALAWLVKLTCPESCSCLRLKAIKSKVDSMLLEYCEAIKKYIYIRKGLAFQTLSDFSIILFHCFLTNIYLQKIFFYQNSYINIPLSTIFFFNSSIPLPPRIQGLFFF